MTKIYLHSVFFLLFSSFYLVHAYEPDSTNKKKVKILTQKILTEKLLMAESYKDSVFYRTIVNEHYWDEADTLGGFFYSLGQIGKPILNFQSTIPLHLWSNTIFIDPISNASNPYLTRLGVQSVVFDTRTPYVNLNFAQSAKKIQLMGIDISQNISPYWNSTLTYKRRTGIGPYLNNLNDQWNFTYNNHIHTKNNRFHALFFTAFNQHADLLNGGTFQDSTVTYETSFNGVAQQVSLVNAKYIQRLKTAETWLMYQIGAGSADSSNFKIAILANARYEDFFKSFTNSGLDTNIFKNFNNPYPLVYQDSTAIDVSYQLETKEAKAGAIIGFNNQKFKWINRGLIFYKDLSFLKGFKPDSKMIQSGLEITSNFDVNRRIISNLTYKQTLSSKIFKPATYLKNETSIAIIRQDYEVVDTVVTKLKRKLIKSTSMVYEPIKLNFNLLIASSNPTFMQQLALTQTLIGNDSLKNSKNFFIEGGIEFQTKIKSHKNLFYLTDYVKFRTFLHRENSFIAYDSLTRIIQSNANESINRLGFGLDGRKHWKRIYLETQNQIQIASGSFSGSSNEIYFENQVKSQPLFQGKTQIFFENLVFERACLARAGVILFYQTGFKTPRFSPSQQIFYYPQSQVFSGNFRLDIFVSAKVKNSVLFLKMQNVLDKVIQPGYYTTSYYPMLGRTFAVGINWNFYN